MAEQKQSSKKKVLTSVLAVALAATMLVGGGTFAYLQGETEDVVNTFNTNEVMVDLYETDAEGNKVAAREYEIIPGTTAKKDPTVEVNTTVDAFVYVEVTDNTEGLVQYEPADGWTELTDYAVGTTKVYYQKLSYVAPEDGTKVMNTVLGVLKDNTVSYSETLENSNMLNEDGTLKTGLDLTFKAYAIQAQPWTDTAEDAVAAVNAYKVLPADVTTANELKAAVANGKSATLAEDVALTGSLVVPEGESVTLDLGGNTLTGPSGYVAIAAMAADTQVTVTNGTLQTASVGVYAYNGGEATLQNVTMTDVKNGAYAVSGSALTMSNCSVTAETEAVYCDSASSVSLTDCELTAGRMGVFSYGANNEIALDNVTINSNYFGIYHNGSKAPSTITVKNSTVVNTLEGACGIYVSNSASAAEKQTLVVENSSITGDTAIEMKHTNATITKSTLTATSATQEVAESGSGSVSMGYAVAMTSNSNSEAASGTVTLSGNTYNLSADGDAIYNHLGGATVNA